MADMKHYAVNEDELADLAIVGNKEYVGVVNVVLAADAAAHEAAAVAAARAEGIERGMRTTGHYRVAYEQGQRDAEARIRAGVKAQAEVYMAIPPAAVLAVIDAAPQEPTCTCMSDDQHVCRCSDAAYSAAAPQDEEEC